MYIHVYSKKTWTEWICASTHEIGVESDPPIVPPTLSPPHPMQTAIAEQPEIREYILQLKTEFGKAADRAAEETEAELDTRRMSRRMSVRRMRQAEKDNMMKDSIKEEAMLRRECMVREVSVVTRHHEMGN